MAGNPSYLHFPFGHRLFECRLGWSVRSECSSAETQILCCRKGGLKIKKRLPWTICAPRGTPTQHSYCLVLPHCVWNLIWPSAAECQNRRRHIKWDFREIDVKKNTRWIMLDQTTNFRDKSFMFARRKQNNFSTRITNNPAPSFLRDYDRVQLIVLDHSHFVIRC